MMGKLSDTMLGDRVAPPTYPEQPGFKVRGTSRDAAAAVASGVEQTRRDVLALLPATADEVAVKLGLDKLYVRPRLSELVADGRATKTTERRKNASGLSAAVYRSTGNQRHETS